MADEKRRAAKTKSLSLRLDPKTKFILELVARIKGQNITTVVERAIKETADQVRLGPEWDERGNIIEGPNWQDFWDPNEGVRTLKLLSDVHYPTTFDEDEVQVFIIAHESFFYTDQRSKHPRRAYVEILWPSIGRYLEIWREKKSEDYWAAGEAMKADLSAARVAPPSWPPKAKPKVQTEGGDLDDEIPF